MKRYPAWQVLFRSFFSMDFYRDVAAHWKEIGFLHLFLLAGMNWAALAIALHVALGPVCDTFLFPLAAQWPTVTAADGKFSMDKESPYRVKDQLGNTIILFDMSGHPEMSQTAMLVTEQGVYSPQQGKERVIKAEEWNMPGSMGPKLLHDCISFVRNYAGLILFVVGWFFGAIFLFIQALLYGIVALIFNVVMKANLSFSKLVRLCAVAMTPPMVIDTLMKAFVPTVIAGQPAMIWALITIPICLIYIGLGVNACKDLGLITLPASAVLPETPATAQGAEPPAGPPTDAGADTTTTGDA